MKSDYDNLIRARIAHYRAKIFVLDEKMKDQNLTADQMIDIFNEKIYCEEKLDYNLRVQSGDLYKDAARQMKWDTYQFNNGFKAII